MLYIPREHKSSNKAESRKQQSKNTRNVFFWRTNNELTEGYCLGSAALWPAVAAGLSSVRTEGTAGACPERAPRVANGDCRDSRCFESCLQLGLPLGLPLGHCLTGDTPSIPVPYPVSRVLCPVSCVPLTTAPPGPLLPPLPPLPLLTPLHPKLPTANISPHQTKPQCTASQR